MVDRDCYADPEDTEKFRIWRVYCKNCYERTPHTICFETDEEDPTTSHAILVCEKCHKETHITLEQHDQILEGKYDD